MAKAIRDPRPLCGPGLFALSLLLACGSDASNPAGPEEGARPDPLVVGGLVGAEGEYFSDIPVYLGFPHTPGPGEQSLVSTTTDGTGRYLLEYGWDRGYTVGNCIFHSPTLYVVARIEWTTFSVPLGSAACSGGVLNVDFDVHHTQVRAKGTISYGDGRPVDGAQVELDGESCTTTPDGFYDVATETLSPICDRGSPLYTPWRDLVVTATDYSGYLWQTAESDGLACGMNEVDLVMPDPVPSSDVRINGRVSIARLEPDDWRGSVFLLEGPCDMSWPAEPCEGDALSSSFPVSSTDGSYVLRAEVPTALCGPQVVLELDTWVWIDSATVEEFVYRTAGVECDPASYQVMDIDLVLPAASGGSALQPRRPQ